jgi:hypothetical protein
VEFEKDRKDGSGIPFKHYQFLQCVGKKLYIFTATWTTSLSTSAIETRIVKSFRLIGK